MTIVAPCDKLIVVKLYYFEVIILDKYEYRVKTEQMLEYVEVNINFLTDYCREKMPEIKPLRPQASFLVWLDCRSLGLDHDQLIDLFINKAGLALNDGEMFNPGGQGFMRLNVGTPREILKSALERLRKAISENL